jgi:HK97 family phage major capsid protein
VEIQEIVSEIKGAYKESVDALQTQVKERDRQIEEFGELKSDMETRLQAAEERVAESEKEYREAKEEMERQVAEGNRPGMGVEAPKSIAEQLTETEEFKHYAGSQKFRGESPTIELKGFFPSGMQRKKTLNSVDGTYWGQMGHLIEPDDLGVIPIPERQLTLRDRIPSFPTTSDTVTYMEELGWANVYTELDANALINATALVVKSTAGLFVGQEIEVGLASNTETRVTTTISAINEGTRTLTVSALPAARTANDPVSAVAIGMTAPGAQKPEASLLGVVERSFPIGTVAHYMTAHRQTLADAPQLQGIVNQRLLFGLAQSAEAQLLYGNGASPNIQGILNNSAIQNHGVYDISDNDAPATVANNAWMLDHVRRAITKVQNANYQATDLMIHPNNWQEIELVKGSDQHYIWVTVPDGGVERLWRVAVNVTPAIREDSFLVGNLQQAAYILDREQANVRFSDQHSDYFTRNMVAILAEERLGLAVVRPQALVKGSFTTQA